MSSSRSLAEGLTALVVDDEPLACDNLRRKLLALDAVREVRTTSDPAEAVALLRDQPPDVLFLDVRMPGLSGFDVLAQFPEPTRAFVTVFCTAYDEHAAGAFEAAALDYLVKPVDPARLAAAVARVRRFVGGALPVANELERARAAGIPWFIERLVVRYHGGARVVELSDVLVLTSEAHHAVAYTTHDEHVLEPSLAALEPQLDPTRFLRCHRASIVQLAHVTAVEADEVTLTGGRTVPLSRRNRSLFMKALAKRAR
jgi:two-component system LytT family response regulator